MAKCGTCNGEMLEAKGCIEHKILLSDGRVIDAPKHDLNGSLDTGKVRDSDRCPDCGAKPDGIHHVRCDWARKPDGSQILIDAIVYWNPEEDYDPREKGSEFTFVVDVEREDSPNRGSRRVYSTLSAAKKDKSEWESVEDAEARISIEFLYDEVDERLLDMLTT